MTCCTFGIFSNKFDLNQATSVFSYFILISNYISPFKSSTASNNYSVYKYFALSENKSVLNWTFCQLLHLKSQWHKTIQNEVCLRSSDKTGATVVEP